MTPVKYQGTANIEMPCATPLTELAMSNRKMARWFLIIMFVAVAKLKD